MGASARCSSLLLALKIITMSSAGGAAVFMLSFYILKRERERETETCATTLMLDSREQHRFFVVVSRGAVSFFFCVSIFGDNASVATRRFFTQFILDFLRSSTAPEVLLGQHVMCASACPPCACMGMGSWTLSWRPGILGVSACQSTVWDLASIV